MASFVYLMTPAQLNSFFNTPRYQIAHYFKLYAVICVDADIRFFVELFSLVTYTAFIPFIFFLYYLERFYDFFEAVVYELSPFPALYLECFNYGTLRGRFASGLHTYNEVVYTLISLIFPIVSLIKFTLWLAIN